MWITRYPWPMEITYDQGLEFISNEFNISLIHPEYGIKAKLVSSGNPTYNTILERMHLVLGNLVRI